MYQIQSDKLAYFNKQINNYNRKITYRLTLNDKSLPIDKVMDNLVITTDSGLEQYGVGSALVAQLQMSVKKEVMILPKDKIKVEIGLEIFNEVSQQWETIYSPLGVFFVDTIEETGVIKKLKAYDGMYKLNKGYFPSSKHTTTQAIANDIANANGYRVTGVINVGINNEQLEGKNCNEMLSLVASAMGRNVRINRSGDTIEFVEPINTNLTFNENHLSTATLDDTTSYNITKLRINYSDKVTNDKGEVTDEGYFTVGEGTDANTLELNNPLLKGQQAQANSVLIAIKKLNGYKRFDTTMPLADYRIEPMDLVTYSKGGVNYLVPILYSKMVLSYQGVSIETQSPTLAPTKSEFSFKGTLTQKVENLYTDIIQVKQLTANKVTTDELEATVATIEKLYATKAEIGELVAGTIIVEELKAQIAEIDKLVANKADINQLTALNATINSLKAQVAEIDNLIAGSILSQIIQSGSISSDLLNVKDGFIKDAMISSLSASKINSGVINTNNVLITSDNGNMTLQGNLLQFKDKNGKVRIQIGQDTKGNYTFTLYDSTGKGVLINEQGIQSSNAIKDGLIVDSKVAGNANISGSKLNISSLYDSMNADGSKTLKASKVHLDDKGQTLDVSFKEMTTKQDGLENTMNTAITDISVSKGQISQLIQDTTITTANGTTTLKDAYNTTKSTVDSHTTSIGNMQSTINSHTGEIQSVKSETASVKAGLNKIELDVKTNYHTKEEVTDKINSAKSETKNYTDSAIKVATDSITQSVSSTYETKTEVTNKVNNAVNGIQVGTQNLIKQTKSLSETNKGDWKINGTGAEGFNKLEIVTTNSNWQECQIPLYTEINSLTSKVTISFEYYESVANLLVFNFGVYNANGTTRLKELGNISVNTDFKVLSTYGSWKRVSYTFDPTSLRNVANAANYRVQFKKNIYLAGTIHVRKPKLEVGTTASNWSPAPEDIDASITSAKNETKEYTKSQINIAKGEITQTVASTYETKAEVTNKINGVNSTINNLTSRVSKAEQKITDSAIIQTVSQTINNAKTEAINSANNHTNNQLKNYSTTQQMNSAIQQKTDSITQSVSSTYETKTEVTNKVNNAVNGIQVGGTNLLLKSNERKQLDRAEGRPYNEIGYAMSDTYREVTLAADTTFSLSFLADRVGNMEFECFDTITMDVGWHHRWTRDDIQQIVHVKGNTYRFIMKPKAIPRGSKISDKITFIAEHFYGGAVFYNVMLVEGHKCLTWSPAPEDVQSNIETTKNEVQKYTDAQIEIAKESITNTVKQNFYSKEETNNQITSKGYATTSQLQQTSDSITAKFSASGGYNLIRNSGFLKEFTFWGTQTHNNPSGGIFNLLGSHDDWGFPNVKIRTAQIRLSNQSNMEYGLKCSVNTTVGRMYTIRFRYAAHRINQANVIVRNGGGGWHTNKYIDEPYRFSGGKGSESNWGTFTHTFKANNTSHILNFVITNAANDGYLWIAEPMVFEGEIDSPYSPHPDEVYSGQIALDESGIRVNASNVGSYTQMSADGFYVFKNDGNKLFEATNKVALYNGKGVSCVEIVNDPSANYGNARIDIRGGINFVHNPGQSTGTNQILLGNHDVSNQYGMHNMSIRAWNSLGFQDNNGSTNMFFDTRRGRIIMKGALYQNTATPPRAFSMNFDGEDEVYNSGFTRDMAVDSIMNLKTGVYVDNEGECCSAIYGGHDELVTTEYIDEDGIVTKHLNVEALNASLVVTCQEQQKQIVELQEQNDKQQKQIDSLQQELAQIKQMLTSLTK